MPRAEIVEIINALPRRKTLAPTASPKFFLKQLPVVGIERFCCLNNFMMALGTFHCAGRDGNYWNAPEYTPTSVHAKQIQAYEPLASRWQDS
ncbi:hypothetical protein Zmor_012328 [Zophobas morio]|uniref:Uncharacterized protein n=1 Tax=Zophobas morio TaxID=2755281 RepID=A0AA38HH87_9CUCU|nr:hypothetical protein Zmor_012328 [Zophobas morio]